MLRRLVIRLWFVRIRIGGRGMEVVYDAESMVGYMNAAVGVTPDRSDFDRTVS